jgi:hypothetical protein
VRDPGAVFLVALLLSGCGGRVGELPVDSSDDAGASADTGSGAYTGADAGAGADTGSIADAASRADARACLDAIPASCPDCVTQNPGDAPVCRQYLRCFATCDPSQPCGAADGVCGVNTLGGGVAPYAAAVATYRCACP